MLISRAELVERAITAEKLLKSCTLCPRNCRANRCSGETGFCGLDDKARCFREVLHYGEEAELVPSHQIYFAGCNLRCDFCAVSEWNECCLQAAPVDGEILAGKIDERLREGARTLNLLGGEPTCSLPGIMRLLSQASQDVRTVWNTNLYASDAALSLLEGVVDVFLVDLKTGNERCAERMLGAKDYIGTVRENLIRVRGKADLIVRHLLIPGHEECCLDPTLDWIKSEMPEVKLSLRGDYLPPADARYAPTSYLAEDALANAVANAKSLGLNVIE